MRPWTRSGSRCSAANGFWDRPSRSKFRKMRERVGRTLSCAPACREMNIVEQSTNTRSGQAVSASTQHTASAGATISPSYRHTTDISYGDPPRLRSKRRSGSSWLAIGDRLGLNRANQHTAMLSPRIRLRIATSYCICIGARWTSALVNMRLQHQTRWIRCHHEGILLKEMLAIQSNQQGDKSETLT